MLFIISIKLDLVVTILNQMIFGQLDVSKITINVIIWSYVKTRYQPYKKIGLQRYMTTTCHR
jgi:hypothetical protein